MACAGTEKTCGLCLLPAGEVISRLGEQLEQAGMQEVFAIPRARMPVVKFVHPDTGIDS
jgi:hypothetical protein